MTRNEIEKRCQEQMQQCIPDKEALWAKIESSLPEQRPAAEEPQKPRISVAYRTIAAAACFLFIVTGGVLLTTGGRNSDMGVRPQSPAANFSGAPQIKQDEVLYDQAEAADEMEAAENSPVINAPGDNLNVAEAPAAEDLDEGEESGFDPYDTLSRTDLILEAQITSAEPGEDGSTVYTCQPVGSSLGYGDVVTLTSATPYALACTHTYLLLLREEAEGYRLVCEDAPQIEVLEEYLLLHDGWRSLLPPEEEVTDWPPVFEGDTWSTGNYAVSVEKTDDLYLLWSIMRS